MSDLCPLTLKVRHTADRFWLSVPLLDCWATAISFLYISSEVHLILL